MAVLVLFFLYALLRRLVHAFATTKNRVPPDTFFFRNRVLEIILSPLQGISMYYPSGVVYNLGLLTHVAPYGIFVLKNETRKIVKIYKFSSLILRVKMSWYLQYILFIKRTDAFWPRVVIYIIGILGYFEL